jgi:hypothetical protein
MSRSLARTLRSMMIFGILAVGVLVGRMLPIHHAEAQGSQVIVKVFLSFIPATRLNSPAPVASGCIRTSAFAATGWDGRNQTPGVVVVCERP